VADVVGVSATLCCLLVVGLAGFAAYRTSLDPAYSAPWTAITTCAALAAIGALVVARIDPRADVPFCRAWAALDLVVAAASALARWRRARLDGLVLVLGFLAVFVAGRVAGAAYGV
jgi:hypothetical protein